MGPRGWIRMMMVTSWRVAWWSCGNFNSIYDVVMCHSVLVSIVMFNVTQNEGFVCHFYGILCEKR